MLILAAFAAPTLGASATAAEATAPLRIVTSFAVESLDPVEQGFWFPEFGVAETPMRVLPEGGLEPWVLSSLDQADGTHWTLRLRPDVTFQNGKPVDAEALAATMSRQLELSPSAQAELPGSSVEVTGDLEVTLTTPAPNATIPHVLADEAVFPVYDVEAVEAAGSDHERLAGAGIYTGPYAVTSLDEQELVLDRYEGYWGGTPPLPGVTVRFVEDAQARILAVQNDEADLALYVPIEAKRLLEGREDAFFLTAPAGKETVTMPFNVVKAPFDDAAVRRAFSLGIDYRSLAEDVMDGAYDIAESMYPTVYPFAVANQKTDLAQARSLLDEAGWQLGPDGVGTKNGDRLEVVLLTYPQQPDLQPLAVAVQAQLAELGFDVEIRQVDDIMSTLQDPEAWNTAMIFSGTTDFTGATESFLRRYLVTGGDRNDGGVSDPKLDELAARLVSTFETPARHETLARIQEIVVEEEAYLAVAALKRFPVVASPAYRDYVPSSSLNHVTFETKPAP
ncbi:MAG: ABC transporter substrate-binding protein [Egibacteraceae bacterium]